MNCQSKNWSHEAKKNYLQIWKLIILYNMN